jgi:hypothetical protein
MAMAMAMASFCGSRNPHSELPYLFEVGQVGRSDVLQRRWNSK